ERGIRQVLLQRSFGDPVGVAINGTAVLRLDRSRLQATRDAAPPDKASTPIAPALRARPKEKPFLEYSLVLALEECCLLCDGEESE
ncbi:MAG: hypothetical protein P8077_08130, partial [Gammaproteobacteria bacterium]